MEKEENAYMQTNQTEDVATASAGEDRDRAAPAEASTELGKFKDVSALLKAYGSLQAEFTRRSQRLKELERQAEKFESASGADASAATGAEKLRKNAAVRKSETQKFDAFVRDIERTGERETENGADETENSELSETETGKQEPFGEGKESARLSERGNTDPSVANCQDAALSSEELLALVNRNESVRLKIVGDYLSSVGKSGAPLMRGGAGLCVSPAVRAKSIGEAGAMALRFFKGSAPTLG